MSDSPNAKRQLRDSHAQFAAQRSTADIYGERHGIPEEVQAALQNIGRHNRMRVQQGRPFVPTQSLPAFPASSGFFTTAHEATEHARLIVKDDLRRRELQPYSSASSSDALSLSPRARAAQLDDQRLRFGPDGDVLLERRRGFKRTGDADDGDVDGTGINHALPPAVTEPPQPTTPTNAASDFPPVFASPALTHPELFGPQAQTDTMPPPDVPQRPLAGLPRRNLRPTMSAPVGRLGSDQGGLRGFGMQVEETQDEDGFDVSDWAADQDVKSWAKSDAF